MLELRRAVPPDFKYREVVPIFTYRENSLADKESKIFCEVAPNVEGDRQVVSTLIGWAMDVNAADITWEVL